MLHPPLTPAHIFEAASLSKPLTGYATVKLLASKGIDLDTPIDNYLPTKIPPNPDPEFIIDKILEEHLAQFRDKGITFRQLLTHTAGIQDPLRHKHPEIPAGQEWTPQHLLEFTTIPPGERGTTSSYSNAGFTLLECLLENIEQKPFPQIMQEQVLDPLGMSSSTFSQSDATLAELQKQHHFHLVVGQNPERVATTPIKYVRAAGGLRTTPQDYAKFMLELCRVYKDDKADNPLKQMLQKQGKNKDLGGLGIGILGPDEDPCFMHSGGNNGFVTWMQIFPKTGQGAVIFVNYRPNVSIYNNLLARIAAVDSWRNSPGPIQVQSIPPEDFAQYKGEYAMSDGHVQVKILEEAGQLKLQFPFPTPDSPPITTPLYRAEDGSLFASPTEPHGCIIKINITEGAGKTKTLGASIDWCPPLRGQSCEKTMEASAAATAMAPTST